MMKKTFYSFYEDRIFALVNKIQQEVCPMEMLSRTVWSDLNTILYDVLHKAAVRTLIAEMHECLEKKIITRSDRKREYQMYMELLDKADYREGILSRYAGLSEFLDMIEENQYRFWMEFFGRLKADWQLLSRQICNNDNSLSVKSIRMNVSDSHLKGRAVIQVFIDRDLYFFYKPHGMGNEIFLQDLICLICKEHGWKSYYHKILDMGSYGWVEGILNRPCSSEEVKYFYQKVGMLSAVSYVLGMGDLHYENIIADKENPVIVDAETLFQYMNPIYQWNEKETIFYSSLTSGLFPGGTVGKNVSGVMGGEGYFYGQVVPAILDDQTSEMRVGYRKPELKKGKNKVCCGNDSIDLSLDENNVIYGFDITYQWFLQNRQQVMEMIIKTKHELYSRYISGGTQFFALGISASTHPQLLMDQNGRRKYLNKITHGRPLGKWETEAMLDGDIPWFCRYLGDYSLYNGQEVVCSHFFEYTLAEELEKRFAQLTYEDNLLQQKVLRLSINVFSDEKKLTNNLGIRVKDIKIVEPISDRWRREKTLLTAKKIADEIVRNGMKYGEKIFWLSLINVGQQIIIKPVDYYLYSGIAGIAVFLRKLCTAYPEYEEISSTLESMLFSYTDKVYTKEISPRTEYTGMYCGEGSIAYTYQLLYQITNNDKYLQYAGKHLQAISPYIGKDRKFDLLYGNAGIVLILCEQYLYTNDICYRNEACQAMELLESNCSISEKGVVWCGEGNENSICSIAHGNSGILLAYARLNAIISNRRYTQRMKQIVAYENQFYDEQTGNWADLRKEKDDIYNTYAWCNGGLGVLHARMQAAKWNPEEKWLAEEVGKIIPLCESMRVREGMCLCHGNVGNLIIMHEISQYLNIVELEDMVRGFRDYILAELGESIIPQVLQESYNMGLMNGLAGIGLGLLCV